MTPTALLLTTLALGTPETPQAPAAATPAVAPAEAAPALTALPKAVEPPRRLLLSSWLASGPDLSLDSPVAALPEPPAISRQLQLRLAGVDASPASWNRPVDDHELLVGTQTPRGTGSFLLQRSTNSRVTLWSKGNADPSETAAESSDCVIPGDTLVSGERSKGAAQADERAFRDED